MDVTSTNFRKVGMHLAPSGPPIHNITYTLTAGSTHIRWYYPIIGVYYLSSYTIISWCVPIIHHYSSLFE